MYPNTYSKKTRALHAQSVLHTYRGKHFKKSNPGGRLRIRKNYWALARNVLTARLSRLQACRNILAQWGCLPEYFLIFQEGLAMPTLQACPHLIHKSSVGPRLCYASAKFLVPSLQQLTSRPSGCYKPTPPPRRHRGLVNPTAWWRRRTPTERNLHWALSSIALLLLWWPKMASFDFPAKIVIKTRLKFDLHPFDGLDILWT